MFPRNSLNHKRIRAMHFSPHAATERNSSVNFFLIFRREILLEIWWDPTATVILSRDNLSQHVFQDLQGCRRKVALDPLEKALLHLPFQLLGVSHFDLPLGRCRGAGGCRGYTVVASRATVGHLGGSFAGLLREVFFQHSHTSVSVVEIKLKLLCNSVSIFGSNCPLIDICL